MTTSEIKDNSTEIEKSRLRGVPGITRAIVDKTLGQLEEEGMLVFPESLKNAEDVSKDQVVLKSQADCYQTGNVMGFLGYRDERLVIRSRFGGDGEDYFFRYLISKVIDIPNVIETVSNADPNDYALDIMMLLFPTLLTKALRKGLFRQYSRFEYNDESIRGTVDVARHISANTPFVGKVAYSRRELSYDNYVMELIRHTIEFMRGRPVGASVLGKVREEVELVVAATPSYKPHDRQRVVEENSLSPIRHAYYREYNALQRLCIQVLRHQRHLIGLGSQHVYGILFDGASLWEEYVGSLIGDSFYHPNNRTKQGKQHLFTREGKKLGEIYPDFIGKSRETRIVADAKYKPIGNIYGRDYLQLLAYMMRFDARVGYCLYPRDEGVEDEILHLNEGSTFEGEVKKRDDIRLVKHGLEIPANADSYESFTSEMEESERLFKDELL